MSDFGEILAEIVRERQSSSKRSILPEAAIERLKEAALRIAAPNPFKVGDMVTPRTDACIKGAGEPHLVVGVNETGFPAGTREGGDWGTGIKFDVLVIHLSNGTSIAPHVAPSWMLEPYNPS